jgi:hypothetical protein
MSCEPKKPAPDRMILGNGKVLCSRVLSCVIPGCSALYDAVLRDGLNNERRNIPEKMNFIHLPLSPIFPSPRKSRRMSRWPRPRALPPGRQNSRARACLTDAGLTRARRMVDADLMRNGHQ